MLKSKATFYLFSIFLLTSSAIADNLKIRIAGEQEKSVESPEELSSRQGAVATITNTTLGLRPNRNRAPANAPIDRCNMHASKLIWTPNVLEMIETPEITMDDFRIKKEIFNEPAEFTEKTSAAVQQRLADEKTRTDQVLNKFREFELLFQDLYGVQTEKLNDPEFEKKETLRAEYWIRDTFIRFSKQQKRALGKTMSKWIRHYLKGNIRNMPSNEKRIVVKRIEIFEKALSRPKVRVTGVFCFDK